MQIHRMADIMINQTGSSRLDQQGAVHLTLREHIVLEAVIVMAVLGAIWNHFKEHWENRKLVLHD